MNPNIAFAPRPGTRRGATRFSLLLIAALGLGAIAIGSIINGCSPNTATEVTTVAQSVPQPGTDVTNSIRTRIAAVVKREVQAHPATAPWCNGLAKTCFEVSGARLPDPVVLESLFGAVSVFAPAEIANPIKAVLEVYKQDYAPALAVQGGGKAYLTALGLGIQDGVKSAGVTEAP